MTVYGIKFFLHQDDEFFFIEGVYKPLFLLLLDLDFRNIESWSLKDSDKSYNNMFLVINRHK